MQTLRYVIQLLEYSLNLISGVFLIVGNADSVLRLAGLQKHVLTDTLDIYSNVFDISHS